MRISRDRWVPWLVLAGGFLAGIGWFVGVAWLWSSSTWTRREKLLATAVVPGGIALTLPILIFSLSARTSDCARFGSPGQPTVTRCLSTWSVTSAASSVPLALLVVAAVAVAVKLEKARRERPPTAK